MHLEGILEVKSSHEIDSVDAGGQYDSQSDQSLIDAINNGDTIAFETIYYRHRDWVVNLAYRFTGDRQLALDVLQETFLYFLKKFPGFKLTAQLRSFFYPAVRNLSIAARRKVARYRSSQADLDQLEALSTTGPEPGAAESLRAALSGLSEDNRETLLLRFVDGLSLDEIAHAMNIPLGTVKSRLHNALIALRHDGRIKELFRE